MEETKKSNGSKLPVIVLAILALAGSIFGGIGLVMAGMKNDEIANLKRENEQKSETISKAEELIGAEIVEAEENKTDDKTEVALKSSDKYIYIGRWGIKLRIPDELGEVQYTFDGYATNQHFCVSGQKKGAQAVSKFADYLGEGNEYPLGCLTRTTDKTSPTPSARRVYEDGDYSFVYAGPQALMGNSWEKDEEVETVGLIEKMLTEGISKF